jgi:hypothetical protein
MYKEGIQAQGFRDVDFCVDMVSYIPKGSSRGYNMGEPV